MSQPTMRGDNKIRGTDEDNRSPNGDSVASLKVTVHRSRRNSLSRDISQPESQIYCYDCAGSRCFHGEKLLPSQTRNSITLQRHLVARLSKQTHVSRISHGTKGGSLAPLALNDS